jgi:hypothetical protein
LTREALESMLLSARGLSGAAVVSVALVVVPLRTVGL